VAHNAGRNRNPKVIAKLDTEPLRGRALAFFKHRLGDGKQLGMALVERVSAAKGSLASVGPIQAATNAAANFEVGQVLATGEVPDWIAIGDVSGFAYPKETSERELAELISKVLEAPQSMCLLEHPLASRGDPWLKRAKSHILTCGDDVYHLLTHNLRAIADVESAIAEADHPPSFLGACGHQTEGFSGPPPPLSTISSDDIFNFASSASCVFVSAYDGEGYLLWNCE